VGLLVNPLGDISTTRPTPCSSNIACFKLHNHERPPADQRQPGWPSQGQHALLSRSHCPPLVSILPILPLRTCMAIYLRTYIYNNPSSKIDEFSTLAYRQKDSTLGTQEYVALMWELPFALLHMNIEPTQDQQIVDLSLNNTHFSKGGIMKRSICGSALLLAVLLSLPATSDAFSRRSSNSEVGPVNAPVQASNYTNGSAQAVPEPPVLLLMSVGVGIFGLGYAVQRFRNQS